MRFGHENIIRCIIILRVTQYSIVKSCSSARSSERNSEDLLPCKTLLVKRATLRIWIQRAFGLTIDERPISEYLNIHFIHSHRVSAKKYGYFQSSNVPASNEFVRDTREFIKDKEIPRSQVDYVDVAKFSRMCGNITTYAPKGGYAMKKSLSMCSTPWKGIWSIVSFSA